MIIGNINKEEYYEGRYVHPRFSLLIISVNEIKEFIRRNKILIGAKNKQYSKGWKNAFYILKKK